MSDLTTSSQHSAYDHDPRSTGPSSSPRRGRLRLAAPALLCAAAVAVGVVAAPVAADAAKLVTGKNVKNGTLRSVDVKNGSLRGVDVKNGSLTGTDVKDHTITAKDLARSLVTNGTVGGPGGPGATGPKGDKGDKGDRGDTGATGPTGATGVAGLQVLPGSTPLVATGNVLSSGLTSTASCPSGQRALGGGMQIVGGDLSQLATRASGPTADGTGYTATVVPNVVSGLLGTVLGYQLKTFVTCAAVAS